MGTGTDSFVSNHTSTRSTSPAYEFRVSRRLRQEFDNGQEYFAMQGAELWLPPKPTDRPYAESLEWHNDVMFRG